MVIENHTEKSNAPGFRNAIPADTVKVIKKHFILQAVSKFLVSTNIKLGGSAHPGPYLGGGASCPPVPASLSVLKTKLSSSSAFLVENLLTEKCLIEFSFVIRSAA